jgi:hypothetical protein
VISLNNDAVISKTLTGYKSGIGKITAAAQYYSSHSKLDGNQFITKQCQSLKIIIFSQPIVPLYVMKLGPINLPEVNSSPGKIYVIKK